MIFSERRWLLPEKGYLYKANLHCHSTFSDGKFSPQELKELYMSRGYHAIAYTDHQICVPHSELTDDKFVALTGLEIAFGIKKNTSIHVCGIARNPMETMKIPNDPDNGIQKVNAGIERLKKMNFITTLNHPRWSGMSFEDLSNIGDVANIEIINGYELMQDGYGDSSACYELELRRGRKAWPIAADDSHKQSSPDVPGFEYFCGFTMLKAPVLTYEALIKALDTGAFFASTGPVFYNLWLENSTLHVECSPVAGVYVHGKQYNHRAAVVQGADCIEMVEIDIKHICEDSDYFWVQIVDTQGKRAWAVPFWLK